jgi:uncharacterized membrane protein YoaK (UPF0700 family)
VTFWNGVLWLHLLGMAFFVGGQLMLAAVVVPAIAFVVLIASGAALAGHEHKWSDSTLHVKMGLVALVGVLIAAHMRWPDSYALDGLVFAVSLAIVWLGIVVGE